MIIPDKTCFHTSKKTSSEIPANVPTTYAPINERIMITDMTLGIFIPEISETADKKPAPNAENKKNKYNNK